MPDLRLKFGRVIPPIGNGRLLSSVTSRVASFADNDKTLVAERRRGGTQWSIVDIIRARGKNRGGAIATFHFVNLKRALALQGQWRRWTSCYCATGVWRRENLLKVFH